MFEETSLVALNVVCCERQYVSNRGQSRSARRVLKISLMTLRVISRPSIVALRKAHSITPSASASSRRHVAAKYFGGLKFAAVRKKGRPHKGHPLVASEYHRQVVAIVLFVG